MPQQFETLYTQRERDLSSSPTRNSRGPPLVQIFAALCHLSFLLFSPFSSSQSVLALAPGCVLYLAEGVSVKLPVIGQVLLHRDGVIFLFFLRNKKFQKSSHRLILSSPPPKKKMYEKKKKSGPLLSEKKCIKLMMEERYRKRAHSSKVYYYLGKAVVVWSPLKKKRLVCASLN